MSLSYIENRENALKRRIVVAEQTALNERRMADDAELIASNERRRADAEKKRADDAVEILKQIVDNNDIKLSQKTRNKIKLQL